jgi:hypothetical protein
LDLRIARSGNPHAVGLAEHALEGPQDVIEMRCIRLARSESSTKLLEIRTPALIRLALV